MRFSYRTTLAAFVAMLAFGSFAVASASAALPEFQGPIEAKKPLQFIFEAQNPRFKAEESTGEVYCEKVRGSGEFTSTRLGTARMTFYNCHEGVINRCHSYGAQPGEIVTNGTPVALVYYSKATKGVGIAFNYHNTGEKTSPVFIADYLCSSFEYGELLGTAAGVIGPSSLNVKIKSLTSKLSSNKQLQEPAEYENLTGAKIATGFFTRHQSEAPRYLGMNSEFALYFEHETEIKA